MIINDLIMNLFERFEVLEGPRDSKGKKYKLIDILIITIYGLLCSFKDFIKYCWFYEKKNALKYCIR